MRLGRLGCLPGVLIVVVSVGCSEPASQPEMTTTGPTTTTILHYASTTPTTTTTTISDVDVKHVFHIVPGPVNGQYTTDVIPITHGGVRPDAVVTLNGVEIQTEYCGAWVEWEDIHCWGFGIPQVGLPHINVELRAGMNTLTFEATYPDGETRQQEFTIYYAPDLIEVEGWLVDIEPGEPTMAIIDIVDLEPGEDDGIDVIGEPERQTIPIASDAAFIILDRTTISARPEGVLNSSEVLDLVMREKNGEQLTHLWWSRILPEEILLPDRDTPITWGVPSNFLLTPDGQLQQMEHWWSP